MAESTEDSIVLEFALEEYRQVLKERRFVMTRYMQAVGLYLALSGFAVREVVDARTLLWAGIVAGVVTILNGLAFYAAGRFRSMAKKAMQRETEFSNRYGTQTMHDLFWGYWGGIALVSVSQLIVFAAVILKAVHPFQFWIH
jgi:sulfite exporter TauE/SafE